MADNKGNDLATNAFVGLGVLLMIGLQIGSFLLSCYGGYLIIKWLFF